MEINSVCQGYDIGKNTHVKYIFSECEVCNNPRWVPAVGDPPKARYPRCRTCAGTESAKKSPQYNGGFIFRKDGRVLVKVDESSPWYEMGIPHHGKRRYVARARIVMAEKLGRCLLTSEIVHHKDLDPSNDDPDNLKLCNGHGEHGKEHVAEHGDNEYRTVQASGKVAWYINKPCIDCGAERIVSKRDKGLRCGSCANKLSGMKPINQYDLDGNFIASFPSVKNASECTGVNSTKISTTLVKGRGTAGGFRWGYA